MTALVDRHRIGRYLLVRRIAVGGMGEVFLARQTGPHGFERQVALKRILPELAEETDLVTLFADEARIGGLLVHPNLVQIYELGTDEGLLYLAMEYVPGHNLARILSRAAKQGVRIPIAVGAYLAAEMLAGLDFAHQGKDADGAPLGIIHRDVSPHNVLVSYRGDVKLMDFGIARAANRRHRTATGVVRGKPPYMSPEQTAGETLNQRTDIFSAGVVLWEATLGRRLFDGNNELEVVRQVTAGPIPKPTSLDPAYPPALERIVMAALERDVEKRTASAAAMLSELREVLTSLPGPAPRAALAALVHELFPDEDAAHDAEHTAVTVSLTDAKTAPLATTGPLGTGPLDAAPAVAAASPPTARALVPRSRPTALPPADEPSPPPQRRYALAAAVALAFAVPIGLALREPRPAIAVPTPPQAPPKSEPTVTPPPAAPIAAPPTVVEAHAATTPTRSPSHRTHEKPARPPQAREPAPTPTPVPAPAPVPAAPAPAAPGTLIVAATPWGTVFVDGKSYGQTDLQTPLSAGRHQLRVEMSAGLGTRTRAVDIEPGHRSKCRVVGEELTCETR